MKALFLTYIFEFYINYLNCFANLTKSVKLKFKVALISWCTCTRNNAFKKLVYHSDEKFTATQNFLSQITL